MNLISILFGAAVGVLLSATLVFLVPAKAIKFAAKVGRKLESKIGADGVEQLRRLAERL